MKTIGLTGNTGSGKGMVAGILQKRGGYIINADEIAHKVIEKGAKAYNEILDCFEDVLDADGNIDRAKLGRIVFADEGKRKILMGITHKYIIEEMTNEMEGIKKSGGYNFIVLDAPLLVEAGLHTAVDEVWLVYSDAETRLSRILLRDGLSREQAQSRINSQTSFEKLKGFADVLIENNGSLAELEDKTNKLLL